MTRPPVTAVPPASERVLPTDGMRSMKRRRLGLAAFALVVIAIATAWWSWQSTDLPDAAAMLAAAQAGSASPLAPIVALAAFVIGGLVVFPVNLLIAASIVVFGPIEGAVVATVGSVTSALLLHVIGKRLPPRLLLRMLGAKGERLRAAVANHGLPAMALIRLLPIAPFSVISVVAGAARIPRLPYLVGSALGMLPGIVLYAVFVDRALAVIADPHPLAWVGLVLALAVLVVVGVLLARWQRRRAA